VLRARSRPQKICYTLTTVRTLNQVKKVNIVAKSIFFKLEIYPVEVLASFGQTNKQLLNDITERWNEPSIYRDIEDGIMDMDCANALVKIFDCQVIIFRFQNNPSNRIIVHECFHGAFKIMDRIGQKLTKDSEESYAYLTDFLFSKITEK
jgi:hypothetical protein